MKGKGTVYLYGRNMWK